MLETDEEAGAVPEVRILVNKVAMKNGTCNEDSTDINDSLYLQWFFFKHTFLAVLPVVTCKILHLSNGKISSYSNTYGSRINFSCNTGYNLTGSESSTCQANGTWSNTAVVCSGKCEFLQ